MAMLAVWQSSRGNLQGYWLEHPLRCVVVSICRGVRVGAVRQSCRQTTVRQKAWGCCSLEFRTHINLQRLLPGNRLDEYITATRLAEICSSIVNGSRIKHLNLLECVDMPNTRRHVSTFKWFHEIQNVKFHFISSNHISLIVIGCSGLHSLPQEHGYKKPPRQSLF